MIEIARHKGPVRTTEKWFAPKVRVTDALRFAEYIQASSLHNVIGFRRRDFKTKVIDLTREESILRAELDKTAAYEVRRAAKDGVVAAPFSDLVQFLDLYNRFARDKGLALLDISRLHALQPHLTLLEARDQKQQLVVHAYLVDQVSGRCRLLHSASEFRGVRDTASRAHIGRANRLLHWFAILHFKGKGLTEYDLGGYAGAGADSPLAGIDQFKDSFGGTQRTESCYTSWLFHAGLALSHRLKRKHG